MENPTRTTDSRVDCLRDEIGADDDTDRQAEVEGDFEALGRSVGECNAG
jgi:hypothetical protein